jgi:hypothetical protein
MSNDFWDDFQKGAVQGFTTIILFYIKWAFCCFVMGIAWFYPFGDRLPTGAVLLSLIVWLFLCCVLFVKMFPRR